MSKNVVSDALLLVTKNLSNTSFILSNPSTQSCRNAPYMEILIQVNEGDTAYEIYNTYLKNRNNVLTCNDADLLEIPVTSPYYYRLIDKNDKRNYICDQQIYVLGDTSSVEGAPEYLNLRFKNCPSVICQIPGGNSVTPGSSTDPYTVSQVSRNTVFVYYPGQPIYFLVDTRNNSANEYGCQIYVMQSFCQQKYPVNINNLQSLGSVLSDSKVVGDYTLPEGVCFAYCVLDSNTQLELVSDSTAFLMQDALSNSYTYLDPKYSDFLYKQQKALQEQNLENAESYTMSTTVILKSSNDNTNVSTESKSFLSSNFQTVLNDASQSLKDSETKAISEFKGSVSDKNFTMMSSFTLKKDPKHN